MKPFALAGGLAGLVASAALAITYVSMPSDPFTNCRGDHGIAVDEIGGPFTLTDETGRRVSDTELVTGPTLLYIGYSFCPDVCPMDNARNAEAAEILAEREGITLQTVFVSVDPDRDTPEQLAWFTDHFHEDMVGLTGSRAEVDAMAEAYHSFYQIQDDQDGYYLIDHSTYSYILMPDHGVVEVVERDAPGFDVADRAACIARAV